MNSWLYDDACGGWLLKFHTRLRFRVFQGSIYFQVFPKVYCISIWSSLHKLMNDAFIDVLFCQTKICYIFDWSNHHMYSKLMWVMSDIRWIQRYSVSAFIISYRYSHVPSNYIFILLLYVFSFVGAVFLVFLLCMSNHVQ